MTPVYLAIDQGTTNCKVLLVSPSAGVVASASDHVELRLPRPGWYEQDAEAMWESKCTKLSDSAAKLRTGWHQTEEEE